MKCDPFFNNIQTYGMYTDDEQQKLMNEYKEFKKHGRGKYKKVIAEGTMKHLQTFKPARLVVTGRDWLFNDDLYKLPEVEKVQKSAMNIREIREMEKKSARTPFYYNKLMRHSQFSPSISSFTYNLKREFPSVKFY